MCAICGIVHRNSRQPVDLGLLLAMRDSMVHRGPDDAGYYLHPGVALGSRRLSILDLSERGRMPMATPDGRYWIVYNGEIYNHRELRWMLKSRGHVFRSQTDTEVLLYLYAAEGPAMLERLNGMFAFAIWDAQERTLFLARDRLGVKPLYYTHREGSLFFASEEKALFAAGIEPRFDPDCLEELLCFFYVAGEQTPFAGVKRLLPGHYLLWKEGAIQVRRWWNLSDRARTLRERLPQEPVEWFRETFDDAVGLRRISDVPVGVMLSGGLDSSSVAASLALQAGEGVASFTVRFSEPGYDEGPIAREVADRWALEPHEMFVSHSELIERLERAAWLQDEPLSNGNDLHVLAISEYAKPRVTVLLSGEGGDETLAGYVRYQPLRFPGLIRAARPVLPPLISALPVDGRLAKLGRFLKIGSLEHHILFSACHVLPDDLRALGMRPSGEFPFRRQVLREARELYPAEPVRQAMYYDQHTYLCSLLNRNDRMTMGASIECRLPFMDYRLVEGLAALPTSVFFSGGQSKALLRRSMRERVPKAVIRHRKWGFGVPWHQHLREVPELRDLVTSLPANLSICDGSLSVGVVKTLADSFLGGENRHEHLIRQLVMMSIWERICLNEAGTLEHARRHRAPPAEAVGASSSGSASHHR